MLEHLADPPELPDFKALKALPALLVTLVPRGLPVLVLLACQVPPVRSVDRRVLPA